MVTGYLDNYYARLGIPRSATQDEIRHAYHLAARKFHPDYNKDKSAVEVFLQIQEAYETLSSATARATYDQLLPADISTPKNLLVNAIYSRQALAKMDRSQLIYVLLNINAAPNPNNTVSRQPLNICVVLDISNSMSGGRLSAIKDTANQIIRALKPEDILSVVAFNDRADVIIPATRNQNLNMLIAKISQVSASGGTEIFKGLETGYQELTKNLNPRFTNHIILVTDGRTYGDEEECLQLAKLAAEQGISIHTIGIGDEWNDEFLDPLASITGGNNQFAETPNAIQVFLQEKFGRIQNTFVNNVTLHLNMPKQVELRYAFRMKPDTSSIIVADSLALGDIPKDQPLSVLMEFLIQSTGDQEEFQFLDGSLDFMMPSAPIPNISSRLTFSRPVSENPRPVPPPHILVQAMSRLSMYRLQEMARKDLRLGNVHQATQRLKNLATQLLTAGEDHLARTVMLELDHIGKNQDMSDIAHKQIKYGTRALVLENFEEEVSHDNLSEL